MTAHRTASLGMYDAPPQQAANDALWSAIAERLRANGMADVPKSLDRARSLDAIWADPGLILAQTCGYPLMTAFAGRLRYVATPCYRAPGCEGPLYRSRIIVRADCAATGLAAMRGATAAINDMASNSGMNLLRSAIAPWAVAGQFLGGTIVTGSHAESVRAVADGRADLAAIDVVTFALLLRDAPDLVAGVRTLGWTALSPGLPLVTSMATSIADLDRLRIALRGCVSDPALADARGSLLLDDFAVLTPARYDAILHQERAAARAGYDRLC